MAALLNVQPSWASVGVGNRDSDGGVRRRADPRNRPRGAIIRTRWGSGRVERVGGGEGLREEALPAFCCGNLIHIAILNPRSYNYTTAVVYFTTRASNRFMLPGLQLLTFKGGLHLYFISPSQNPARARAGGLAPAWASSSREALSVSSTPPPKVSSVKSSSLSPSSGSDVILTELGRA